MSEYNELQNLVKRDDFLSDLSERCEDLVAKGETVVYGDMQVDACHVMFELIEDDPDKANSLMATLLRGESPSIGQKEKLDAALRELVDKMVLQYDSDNNYKLSNREEH